MYWMGTIIFNHNYHNYGKTTVCEALSYQLDYNFIELH